MDEHSEKIRTRSSSAALVDAIVPLGFLLLVLVLAYELFSPLFTALIWGSLLTIIFTRPYERLAGRLRGRRLLVDIIFGTILLMVLLLPVAFFAWELVSNLPSMAQRLQRLSEGPMPPFLNRLAELPVIGPSIVNAWNPASSELAEQAPELLTRFDGLANWLLSQIGGLGTFFFEFVLGSVVALFLLHHRFAVAAFVHRLMMRVGGKFAAALVLSAFNTTRATFTGVILAAIAQTMLATIALYIAGVPGLILFAGFTFLLALVQIGPLAVIVVADGILLAQGSWVTAVLLTAWFLIVVTSADNLIRPYFASHNTSVPGILTFLGAIGGFLSWGLIGVFVGPVLSSVLYEMLVTWVKGDWETSTELEGSRRSSSG